MRFLKKAPLFLFLLVLFFCLHGAVENYGYVRAAEIIEVGLIALLCTAAFFGICWLISKKNRLLASLVCFFITAWYLFFGAIHDTVKKIDWLSFMHSYSIIVPLLVIATIGFIFLMKRKPALQRRLVFYLNILLLIYCIYDGFLLIRKFSAKQEVPVPAISFDLSKVKEKPNVYFLLFDCYAGFQSLQDSFGFRNDSLYKFLTERSFKVLPSVSNYNFTFFSMSSMLNMRYLPGYSGKIAVQKDMQERLHEIKHAEIFSVFKEMGYQIENNSIFDLDNNKGISGNNRLIPMNAYLLTHKIFHNRLIKDLGYLFYRFEYFSKKHVYKHDRDNQKAIENTLATVKKPGDLPKFVYAHLLMPHAPYYKDSLGNYLPVSRFNVGSKDSYLSYLKYTNTVIESMIGKIISRDPNAILILTSDHGYNDKGQVRIYDTGQIEAEQYSFDNLLAIRIPGQLPEITRPSLSGISISSVNLFRYVLNRQFGQQLPYLKDSTVWVNHD